MTAKKQTKMARILELERKLRESDAAQVHVYHFADASIDKASTDHLMASGVILSLTVLGGREIFSPVLIRNGLSKETVAAIKKDLIRSYQEATVYKPKGVLP